MKIMVVGASGTLGQSIVQELEKNHDVIRVGKSQGDFRVDITDDNSVQQLFASCGPLDAIIAATGEVYFGPLLGQRSEQFNIGLQNKLLGQVRLVLYGRHVLHPEGSFTFTTGILAQHPIPGSVNATTASAGLEGFVLAAVNELRPQRINVVSPTILTQSIAKYGPMFKDFKSVDASIVAQAYRQSVEGNESGKIYQIWGE